MATRKTSRDARWLTPDELETWRALHEMVVRLPAALGSQLQNDSGLSFIEYYVLAALSDQTDHTLRLSQLAALANSELSRLSHLITRMEKRGFVRRAPDPSDGRFNIATLTPSGLNHLVEAAPGHVAEVRRLIFDALDERAQHDVRTAARAIVRRVDEGDL
ncbi:MarR family transcriptional regulator [Nocardioides pocheonensis]|uniref:MarR family transcriptional regulator n=2 Tax=Nocardioides pocheonensis TaxID=661485 RepID=A0A3N0GIQ7_9ACTN|nr:MarR family transcriptional regulator [Nocardioides pocheonensis]